MDDVCKDYVGAPVPMFEGADRPETEGGSEIEEGLRFLLWRERHVLDERDVIASAAPLFAIALEAANGFLLARHASQELLHARLCHARIDHRDLLVEQAIELLGTIGHLVGIDAPVEHAKASEHDAGAEERTEELCRLVRSVERAKLDRHAAALRNHVRVRNSVMGNVEHFAVSVPVKGEVGSVTGGHARWLADPSTRRPLFQLFWKTLLHRFFENTRSSP